MAKAGSIPVITGPQDLMHDGIRTLKTDALAPHPVQAIQANMLKDQWQRDLYLTERVYGAAAAWEKRMDRAVLSQVRRLPGIPSAHCGLDTVLGRDDKLGWEDVLGKPEGRPDIPKMSVHEAMERKLKL